MNRLNPDDVARLRAAKRAIIDITILVCVAVPVGDPEGAKMIRELRATHRRINRYLDADKEKAAPAREG